MRPSLDWTPGVRDSRANSTSSRGTALPVADTGSFDEFFRAGDEGRYEGGPADFEPFEDEERRPLKFVPRTREQEVRRARLIKAVAMVVGCFAAITAVAVFRSSTATASVPVEARPVAAQAKAVALAPAAAPQTEAAKAIKVEPAPPPTVEPVLADAPATRSEPAPVSAPPAAKRASQPHAIPASHPAAPEPEEVDPEPAPKPAPPPAPITPSGPPPTAAFPVS